MIGASRFGFACAPRPDTGGGSTGNETVRRPANVFTLFLLYSRESCTYLPLRSGEAVGTHDETVHAHADGPSRSNGEPHQRSAPRRAKQFPHFLHFRQPLFARRRRSPPCPRRRRPGFLPVSASYWPTDGGTQLIDMTAERGFCRFCPFCRTTTIPGATGQAACGAYVDGQITSASAAPPSGGASRGAGRGSR